MKLDLSLMIAAVIVALLLGFLLGRRTRTEGFNDFMEDENEHEAHCNVCGHPRPCGCAPKRAAAADARPCPPCMEPDASKWVLKATVPPCAPLPDMSKYMLKTECPPLPDMSKYVLKSSVPNCPPCISTCSKPCKIGECAPCPRPRCPTVQCPEPKACPACPAASCAPCPQPDIKCKAAYTPGDPVRPMLASTNSFGF